MMLEASYSSREFRGSAGAPASARRDFKTILTDLGYPVDWQWAWDHYKPTVLELAREYGLKRHLEIGGGRDPLFHPEELEQHGIFVALNDISAQELSLAPSGFQKFTQDICALDAPAALGVGSFDFVYSRMLMEHLHDVPQMWRNLHAILAPGGVALSFFPTLYAPVFAINRIMPERLTRATLEAVFPDRKPDGDNPKFPALWRDTARWVPPPAAPSAITTPTSRTRTPVRAPTRSRRLERQPARTIDVRRASRERRFSPCEDPDATLIRRSL